ncbi:proteasome assembly chaperone 3 isoform X1 [Falco naumanni]|uniref:proteasome assembly chaperone 3 isoform X1 n=1 Tax=Falco naumanni TaxID=148594 RepID=UPI001ADE723E|nr:proteasome assembly chaperone 3 isoform X1 [Falco naumanni]
MAAGAEGGAGRCCGVAEFPPLQSGVCGADPCSCTDIHLRMLLCPEIKLTPAAMEARPIVTSKQREEVVHGVPTEVVCTAFSNSVLVVVTQYGKMGTIVYVDPNTVGDNVGRPSLTTKVLLGKDEPLVHVCAKNLVAFVSQEAGNKPVLLAMALKDKTMEGIQALREVIRSCQVW